MGHKCTNIINCIMSQLCQKNSFLEKHPCVRMDIIKWSYAFSKKIFYRVHILVFSPIQKIPGRPSGISENFRQDRKCPWEIIYKITCFCSYSTQFPEKCVSSQGKYTRISCYAISCVFRVNKHKEILGLQKFDMLLYMKHFKVYS